jgi:hypothetical protein
LREAVLPASGFDLDCARFGDCGLLALFFIGGVSQTKMMKGRIDAHSSSANQAK